MDTIAEIAEYGRQIKNYLNATCWKMSRSSESVYMTYNRSGTRIKLRVSNHWDDKIHMYPIIDIEAGAEFYKIAKAVKQYEKVCGAKNIKVTDSKISS